MGEFVVESGQRRAPLLASADLFPHITEPRLRFVIPGLRLLRVRADL
jgi:hypothetical protein